LLTWAMRVTNAARWGISTDYYHGQRSKRDRARVQDAFMDGGLRVIVALEHEDVVGRRRGRLHLLADSYDPDAISLEAEERRRAYESSRLAMMRGYAEAAGCRREYIMNYFGEPYDPRQCQMCDNSLRKPASAGPVTDGAFAIGGQVRHASWGEGIVERTTPDSVTVLFDAVGFKTLDLTLVEERGLLEAVSPA
jgi:ATP-dependent DNA helicase RecQ